MFDGLEADLALELVESRAFEGGAVALRYRRGRRQAGDPFRSRIERVISGLPECAAAWRAHVASQDERQTPSGSATISAIH